MATYTSTGTKVFIGTTVACDTLAEFQADTYVEVKQLAKIGDFGDEATEIDATTIEDARKRTIKGVRDAGTFELEVNYEEADPGQSAMRVAAATDLDYNLKLVLNNKPTPTGTPTEVYLRVAVLSQRVIVGEGNGVLKQQFKCAINEAPISKPAAA